MQPGDHEQQHRACSRRRLLASAVGLSTAAVLPGATTGQTQDDNTAPDNGEPPADEEAMTEVGLSAAAPTFDRPDHEGLFIQVHGESDATIPEGAAACEFLGANPLAYAVTLLDPTEETENGEAPAESTPIYVPDGETEIEPGAFFVISRTHSCAADVLAAELELTDEEAIEGDVGPGTGPDEEPGA